MSICRACVTPSELRAFESGLDHPVPVPQGEVERAIRLALGPRVFNAMVHGDRESIKLDLDEAVEVLLHALAALTTPQTEGE